MHVFLGLWTVLKIWMLVDAIRRGAESYWYFIIIFAPFGRNEEELSSRFCSELVAAAYQQMGLLPGPPDGAPSNEYTPRDFSAKGDLPLPQEIRLGKETPLTV